MASHLSVVVLNKASRDIWGSGASEISLFRPYPTASGLDAVAVETEPSGNGKDRRVRPGKARGGHRIAFWRR